MLKIKGAFAMAQKKTNQTRSRLSSWFFKEPAKFALLSFVLMTCALLVYMLIAGLVAGENAVLPLWPPLVMMTAMLAFSVYKLVGWLPKDNLDRKSFVAIDSGQVFIYYVFLVLSSFSILGNTREVTLAATMLMFSSSFWFFAVAIIAAIVSLYFFGLLVGNIYAAYRRALAMGVPKIKALLAMPFASVMFWFPGYLLPDDSKAKPAVEIRAKWYSNLVDWIVSKPINALAVFALTLVFSALFMDFFKICFSLLLGSVFLAWILISGVKGFKKNIGGAYSTVAGALNAAIIIICVCFAAFIFSNQQQPHHGQDMGIRITEVSGDQPAE
jgi:hypothetical protein